MTMQSERIAILVDSCSDVPEEIREAGNMAMVPMNVIFRDHVYEDRITITPAEFYRRQQTETATTASPTGKRVVEALDQIKAAGFTHVIAVTISSALSGTFQEIQLLAEDAALQVAVIDTKNIGIGSGMAAIYAAQLIKAGHHFASVVAEVQRVAAQSRVFFYVPDLKYLIAGGRIGRVAGMAGSLLNIKPIISCDDDGVYYPVAKVRGEKKTLDKMLQLVAEAIGDHQQFNLAVANGVNESLAADVATRLRATYPTAEHLFEGDISPALGVHTGPGLIGIGVQILDGGKQAG